jgi:phosphoglycolate phosphatase
MVAIYPKAVIFDLDGTLIDSVPEVCAALNTILEQAGRRRLGIKEAFDMVGGGAKTTLAKAFAATGAPLDDTDTDRVIADYFNAYKAARGANTTVYPGVREVLDLLKGSGTAMTICTNKSSVTTTETLAGLDLLGPFSRIVCPEHVANSKPHADHVIACLEPDGIAPADAVLVGDSETDMAAARAAGVRFIAVSYGYSHVPIEELHADAVVDHFGDLLSVLADFAA